MIADRTFETTNVFSGLFNSNKDVKSTLQTGSFDKDNWLNRNKNEINAYLNGIDSALDNWVKHPLYPKCCREIPYELLIDFENLKMAIHTERILNNQEVFLSQVADRWLRDKAARFGLSLDISDSQREALENVIKLNYKVAEQNGILDGRECETIRNAISLGVSKLEGRFVRPNLK